jgi:dynein heavy chain
LDELVDSSTIAEWGNQGLPDDRFSKENAAIIEKAKRWPLIIDPQLQASKYLKKKYQELIITSFTDKKFDYNVQDAIANGKVLIIENVAEELEPSLDPVLQRAYTTKNKKFYIKLGDDSYEVHANFKLIMLSKLINPHYKPEYAAMCTIMNFIVTEDGLKDQLLALVVREEK